MTSDDARVDFFGSPLSSVIASVSRGVSPRQVATGGNVSPGGELLLQFLVLLIDWQQAFRYGLILFTSSRYITTKALRTLSSSFLTTLSTATASALVSDGPK
jgi:hypothetical protein